MDRSEDEKRADAIRPYESESQGKRAGYEPKASLTSPHFIEFTRHPARPAFGGARVDFPTEVLLI